MAQEIKLFKHQQELLEKNPKQHLLAWGCGSGKSLTAIKLVEKNAKSCLIVCPKSLKDNWKNELKKYSVLPEIKWTILSKEEFKKAVNDKKVLPHNAFIGDEAHYFGNMKSQLTKAVLSYLKEAKPDFVYLLTATPYMSSVWNVFALGRILGRNWNYITFKNKYFYYVRMGMMTIPKQREGIENEVAKLIHQLGSTKKLEECADVPDSVFLTEYFELTAPQKKAIKELEDFLPIVLYTKQHQICGGTLSGELEDSFFKSEKTNRIIDLAKEHDKMVVVCRYNAELIMLKGLLTDAKIPVLILNGSTKGVQTVIDTANSSKRMVLLVNAKCSTGYNLPDFDFMVFYSLDFSLVHYLQMLGRIQRINNLHKCVYVNFVTKKTIDENVYECIQRKESFDIEIYAREKSRLQDIK